MKKSRNLVLSLIAFAAIIQWADLTHGQSNSGALYWSFHDPNGFQPVLKKANLDGTNPQTLLQSGSGGDRPIALDVPDGYLYAGYSGTITRYDLNGNNPTVIFNTISNPSGISGLAVDTIHDALYWTFHDPNGLQPVLIKANLDGTNPQTLLQSGSGGPRPIALDVPDGYLYAGYSGTITRYDLNGNNPTVIFNTFTNPSGISGLAVDTIHDALYWTFHDPNGLQPVLIKANLDGTNPQTLLQSGSGGDRPIALDVPDGYLYAGYSGTITRYDLNGNSPTVIFNTFSNPSGISGLAVIPVPEPSGFVLMGFSLLVVGWCRRKWSNALRTTT